MSETLEPALPDRLDQQAERLMRRLAKLELSVATAESCTGGMMAALLTDIEGAGHSFERGFVTYTKDSKSELLGIEPSLLQLNDGVSEVVAAPWQKALFLEAKLMLRLQSPALQGPQGPAKRKGSSISVSPGVVTGHFTSAIISEQRGAG